MPNASPGERRQALADLLSSSLERPIPEAVERRIPGAVRIPGKVTAIIGVRRAGKTTFVHQLRRERLAAGIPGQLIPYINFEHERLAELDASDLGFLLDEYRRLVPNASRLGTVLWSLDEIQVVAGWERFVRRIMDAGNAEVTVTGSSAALLSREIGTALRGRAWSVPLFPFSFAEVLIRNGLDIPDVDRMSSEDRGAVEAAFLRWLEVGGFPEAQDLDPGSRRQLLRDYVDVAMLRDVVERHQVSNITGLRWLVRHLLGNAAGSFSVEKFHRALKSQGIAISRDTLHQLVAHLEDCFLVRTVWMEADSERQRMVNPRKAYPVDTGLIPIFDRTGRGNIGHALETAVLVELERRRCDVTYVRTALGREVDFLARTPSGSRHLIQVCADATDAGTADREMGSLEEAGVAHAGARRWLLTLTRDRAPAIVPDEVTTVPAWQWMLLDWDSGT
jgi:hypothetical protein